MTDAQLRDAAVASLKRTQIKYADWKRKVDQGGYADVTQTEWWKAFDALGKIGAVVVPPPPPPPPPPSGSKLSWAPPPLSNPITLNFPSTGPLNPANPGQYWIMHLDPARDYIINIGHRKETDGRFAGIVLDGGRNVRIIGGRITIPTPASAASDDKREALVFHNTQGTVHVEGVLIDGAPLRAFVFGKGMANGVFQIQNCRAENIYYYAARHGGPDTLHSDGTLFFTDGAIVRFDRFTCYSDNTGFANYTGTPESVFYRRVNLRNTPAWKSLHNNFVLSMQQTRFDFDDVWMETGFGMNPFGVLTTNQWTMLQSIGPRGGGIPLQIAATGDGKSPGSALTFTNPAGNNIWGPGGQPARIEYGAPAAGDFVPAGVAGTAYVSPGYA